jgi:hypothetical protein
LTASHSAHEVEPAYAQALGQATYAFALLEWQAIRCCEALSDGYAGRMHHTTAGEVGEDLQRMAHGVGDPHPRNELAGAADEFRRLVRVRNALAHARPGHDPAGRCILVNGERPWTVEGILGAVREFEACAGRLERCADLASGAV